MGALKQTQCAFVSGLCAYALIPALAASTYNPCAPIFTELAAPVSVPAQVSGHAMFVAVLINGRGPFHMFVDTGCSVTLVSPELAAAVGAIVPAADQGPAYGRNGFGDLAGIQRVQLESIDLGGAHFSGVTAGVAPGFGKLAAVVGERVDGTLGFPLFADLFVALDFPKHRILLSTNWPADLPPVRAELPVDEQSNVPFVQVRVQGRTVPVLIDTGSNGDMSLPATLGRAMRWEDEPRPGALVAVVGEVGREQIGRLAGNLRLDQVRQPEPTASVSSGPASIGLRLLENFCVVFHESENRMWLCSADDEPGRAPIEYSIGLSLLPSPGGWRVAGIIPGSPAERAHLRAGALITEIEGHPAQTWTRDQIQDWIDSHDAVALTVSDQTGRRNLSLRVWPLVP
jgi:predicted aspartyl protease